jgi:hypothetical protein
VGALLNTCRTPPACGTIALGTRGGSGGFGRRAFSGSFHARRRHRRVIHSVRDTGLCPDQFSDPFHGRGLPRPHFPSIHPARTAPRSLVVSWLRRYCKNLSTSIARASRVRDRKVIGDRAKHLKTPFRTPRRRCAERMQQIGVSSPPEVPGSGPASSEPEVLLNHAVRPSTSARSQSAATVHAANAPGASDTPNPGNDERSYRRQRVGPRSPEYSSRHAAEPQP